jgi:glycosyltransferase involved in cell wall biosynthesis
MLRLAGVGALVRWKGWHLVIEALASLPSEIRAQIRFRHIGGPGESIDSQHYADGLRAMTVSLGLAGTVEWLGEQSSADALLAESDCLLVASDHEPFSIAVLEALSAGLPVLAADSGGARDLLKPDETGWFFRSGDAADLARVIATLVKSDALSRVRVTPETVRAFTAPIVVERWEQVYAML